MRAAAAERYASAVSATHSGDPDMLAAAGVAMSRGGRDGVLAMMVLRALAGNRGGVDPVVDDLTDVLMRASFRGKIRKMPRESARAAASLVLDSWLSGMHFGEFRGNPVTALAFDRLERLVAAFSRDLEEVMA